MPPTTKSVTDRIRQKLAGHTSFTFRNKHGMHHQVSPTASGFLVVGGYDVVSHHPNLETLIHELKPTPETIQVHPDSKTPPAHNQHPTTNRNGVTPASITPP